MASSLTFPVTAPTTPAPSESRWFLRQYTASVQNDFDLSRNIASAPAARWESAFRLPSTTRDQLSNWLGFLAGLRGSYGSFYWGPSVAGDPSGAMASDGGSPLIKDAGAALAVGDTVLTVDGFTAGAVTGFAKTGDWFEVDDYLYRLTEDSNKNASGEVTFTFQPPLKTAPADNAPVTVTSPKGVFRLKMNSMPQIGFNGSHVGQSVTLAIEEI